MKKTQDYKVDRTGWKSGAWDGEPDRLEWKTFKDRAVARLIAKTLRTIEAFEKSEHRVVKTTRVVKRT